MIWTVELKKTAEKQFLKLDRPVRKAAQALFDRLERIDDPRTMGHALSGPLAGKWTYTVHGDWRAVAEIHDNIITISVLKILPPDKVYY